MTRRISSGEYVSGFPAKEIRHLLRSLGQGIFGYGVFVHCALKVTSDVEVLCGALLRDGYLRRVSLRERRAVLFHGRAVQGVDDEASLQLTPRGCDLASGVAYRPIGRATAERLVRELLGRVVAVNAPSSPYALRVKSLDAFGSYVQGSPTLNDIDLVLALESCGPREDPLQPDSRWQKRIAVALDAGRQFSNVAEEACWPDTEVRQFLRAKSRFLRFHSPMDGVVASTALRRLWPLQADGPQPVAATRRSRPNPPTPIQFAALVAAAIEDDPVAAAFSAVGARRDDGVMFYSQAPWRSLDSLVRRGLLQPEKQDGKGRTEAFALTTRGWAAVRGEVKAGRAERLLRAVDAGPADRDKPVEMKLAQLVRALRQHSATR